MTLDFCNEFFCFYWDFTLRRQIKRQFEFLGKENIFQKYKSKRFLLVWVTPFDNGTYNFFVFFRPFPKKYLLCSFSWMGQIDKVHRAKLQYWNGCVQCIDYSEYIWYLCYCMWQTVGQSPRKNLYGKEGKSEELLKKEKKKKIYF